VLILFYDSVVCCTLQGKFLGTSLNIETTADEGEAYGKAAHEHHGETFKYTGTADDPGVSDKHHQTENVLNRWQINAQHDAQLRSLQ